MHTETQYYLLQPSSASLQLIRKFARRKRLSVGDATLLRARLGLELRKITLGITPQKKLPRRAA